MEELDQPQFLEIPKQMKTTKSSEQMPTAVTDLVEDQLRPFVVELKNKLEAEKKGKKRKHSETDSESVEKKPEADEPNGPQPDEERKMPPWRISIHDLKIFGDLGKKAIAGKVVQKSGLRTYQTKNKEEKFFFYLGVADETSSIKVMVYGREHYQHFQEESFYLFRNIIMEKDLMKMTKMSNILKTTPLPYVPKNLEMEARMLVYAQIPVCSITQVKTSEKKTSVSVEGTITEIGSVEKLKARQGRSKQEFKLEDSTGSIRITLWGDDIKQLRGKSQGDVVRVINVTTSRYYDTVSLNSTTFTRIVKIQSAAVQNITIEIIGIIKASRTQTELGAQINSREVQTFVVDSSLLADVVGVRLEGDFEDKLLSKMPFSADAEVEGNKINKIKSAKQTKMSNISQTSCIDVSEKVEMEARMLVDSQIPVCSIAGANSSEKKTSVNPEGTITERMDKKEPSSVIIRIINSESYLEAECVSGPRANIEIHQERLTLRNFSEVSIKNSGNVPMLEHTDESHINKDDHPESQHIEGERHFVDEQMCELIQRVSNIGPILDELLQEQVIQREAYDRIRALPNSQDKMRELYSGPLRAGTTSRDAFYRILQKHEKMLTEDLGR